MANNILEKLKNILDYTVIGKFNNKEFAKYHFIPAFIKDSDVMIVTVANSDHSAITSIVSSVLNIPSARYSVVEPSVFKALLEIVNSNTLSSSDSSSSDDDDFDDIGDVGDLENFDDIKDFDDDLDIPDTMSVSIQPTKKQQTPSVQPLPQNTVSGPVSSEDKKYSDKAARFAASLNNSISKVQKLEPVEELKLDIDDKPADISLTPSPSLNPIKEVPQSSPASEEVHVDMPSPKTPVGPDLSNIDTKELSKKKIGEILVELGYVNQDNLFTALIEAKKTHIPLGTILVQRKFVTLDNLKKALSLQQGYDFVDEEKLKINANVIKMLPEDFIKLNKVIPISFEDNTLTIGMINPNDKKVINDIVYLTGIRPRIMLITHYEFNKCVDTYFSQSKRETDQIIKKMEDETLQMQGGEETLFEQAERELKDDSSTTVKFVNKIVSDAIDMGASDIHIEPRLDCYVVRYRVDGILQEVLRLPSKTESAILTRLKVISKMNIAEHRRPQDGSFTIRYKNKDYDFRINTLPVSDKEKMVIRILAPAVSIAAKKEEINLVGATKDDIELIKKINNVPNGIILATGPTGSGKTTTLYTLLKSVNDEGVNITTIEDPVEIKIEGINQSQINTKAGITFASCLRAILRQDPDIILIGEIRDYETLEAAISAALTGHLVLSTLHTNSAAATITRLIEMGAKNYLVSSTVAGIVAQRLVRHLCPDCKEQYFASEDEAKLVVSTPDEIAAFMKMPIYRAKGCDKCKFKGYTGRIGVYEILQVSKEIKKLIAQGAHDIEIEEAAVGLGMNTLQQACLKHIIAGETTIQEFVRVLGPVTD